MKDFMIEALKEARKSYDEGEVPIGAVVVLDGKIIGRGRNLRQSKQNAISHAEIIAIERACKMLNSWRLENAEIYVTLEPCPMCSGAIANARIKKLVYACQEKTSCDGLCEKILTSTRLNHKVDIIFDKTYEEISQNLLSSFFKEKRKK